MEILCREPKPLRQIDRNIPRELERICLKCLRKPIAERYTAAGDLADDLQQFLVNHDWDPDGKTGWTSRSRSPLHRRLVLAGTLLSLLAAFAIFLRWTRSPADAYARIDVRVWDPAASQRQGIDIRQPQALPLRPGDQVRLDIHVRPKAYAYVLWIDAQGRIVPVYPWVAGQWSQRGPEVKIDRLSLPFAAEEAWTMQSEVAGMETIVLLLNDRPCPDLETRIAQHQSAESPSRSACSLCARVEERTGARARSSATRSPTCDRRTPFETPW